MHEELEFIPRESVMTLVQDDIYVIETHIDDMNHEILGFVMDLLLDLGALDVAFSPIQMKNNRPAVRMTVISPSYLLEHLARVIMTESTASDVRYYPVRRLKMERAIEERNTSFGTVKVKVIKEGDIVVRIAPEYEDCRRIAYESGIPLLEVYRIVEREATWLTCYSMKTCS